MMKLLSLVALVALSASAPVEQVQTYHGDKVVQMQLQTDDQLKLLQKLHEDLSLGLDFWVRPNLHTPVDVHVPSDILDRVQQILQKAGIKYSIVVEDLQSMIDKEKAEMEQSKKMREAGISVPVSADYACPWWYPNCNGPVSGGGNKNQGSGSNKGSTRNRDQVVGTWVSHTEVNSFLGRMASTFSSRASVQSIGNSYQGRDMKMIKITNGNGRSKPIIFVESTIHAREWLTQGTVNYLIDRMTRDYDSDAAVKTLLDTYDVYVVPVSNPDGYEYTRSTSRLWRKTRRPSSSSCYGTDPNRNWDFHWGESGVSQNPCADTYPGSAAFSEPETRNIRDAVNSLASSGQLSLYFSMHSYSQLWLTPWGYASNKPSDNSELVRVAQIGEAALRRTHGVSFQVGAPPDILYAASGGSYDWAKGVAGVKYSYTLELRPSGSTWNGFVVSESTIVPSGEEVFAGFSAIATEIAKARG